MKVLEPPFCGLHCCFGVERIKIDHLLSALEGMAVRTQQ
jgi:hypothetical protein